MTENKDIILNLGEIVNQSLTDYLASGKLKEALDKHISDCITSEIKSACSYGAFNKSLAAAVKEALTFEPAHFKLDDYRGMVISLVQTHVDEHMEKELATAIKEDLQMITSEAPQEIKLSELWEKFKELEADPDSDSYGSEFSIREEMRGSSDYFTYFIFKRKEGGGLPALECRLGFSTFRIHSNEATTQVFSVCIDDEYFTGTVSKKMGHGFGLFAAAMKVRGTKVHFDVDADELD